MEEPLGASDQFMGEGASLRNLEGANPFPDIPSEFRWDSDFPPFEPWHGACPHTPPRAKVEFDIIWPCSKEEYEEYWTTRAPISAGMCISRCYIAGHGRDALIPRIGPDGVRSPHDVGDRDSKPKRPNPKRETKGEDGPAFPKR